MRRVWGAIFGCSLAFAAAEAVQAIGCDMWATGLFHACQ